MLTPSQVELLELDSSDVKLIAERMHGPSDQYGAATVAEAALAADDVASTARRAASWRRFKWFRSTRVYENVARAFRLVGRHGDVRGVADHLAAAYRSTPGARPQLALVIAELVAGACGEADARDLAWGARAAGFANGGIVETDSGSGTGNANNAGAPHHASTDVEGVVRMAVVCVTDDAVWQLPTHLGAPSDAATVLNGGR
jgi:hypothetical protein